MFRGQRRRTTPQVRWKRSLSVVALAGLLTSGLVVAVGTGPAVAKGKRHPAAPRKAYTLPAENSTAKTVCEPTATKPCPRTNDVWSGYVLTPVTGRAFTSVSANWTQMSAICPQPDAWALFWVGLDGWSSFDAGTVEQGGTSAECVGGVAQYEAWWEMYPTNSVQLTYPVHVGDHMSASVVFSATAETYTVTVDDVTSGDSLVAVSALNSAASNPNTYTLTVDGVSSGPVSYLPSQVCNVGSPCQNTSAEFVVEAPGGDNGGAGSLYPLAHFRRVTFTGAAAADNMGDAGPIINPTAWSDARVDLTSMSGKFLASATGLKKSGAQFRDVWDPQ